MAANSASALLRAVEKGEYGTTSSLLEAGGNPNLTYSGGSSLLHIALSHKNFPLAELLMNKGADVNAPDPKGNVPLQILFPSLIPGNPKEYIAALHALNTALNKGANPNVKINKVSLLVSVIQLNRPILAELIIKAGADVNVDNPLRALLVEIYESHYLYESVLALLFERNVDLSVVDEDGNGYGHGCIYLNLPEVLDHLLFYGLDPMIKNKEGKTIFDLAAEKGDRELMTLIGNYMTKKNIKARTARRAISGIPSLPNNVAHRIANFAVGELTPNEPRWRTGALVPGLTRKRLYTPAYEREQEANIARKRNTAVRKIQKAWKSKKTRKTRRSKA